MSKNIICKSCAAEFADNLPKCPYCESLNLKGAEAEYLGKLNNVKEDMQQLENLPEQAQKKELKKQIKFWIKVALIIFAVVALIQVLIYWLGNRYERDEAEGRADFIWLGENAPKLDALYEKEDYQGLLTYFVEWAEEETGLPRWEHWEFLCICHNINWAKETLAYEASGVELSLESCQDLFYNECVLKGVTYREDLTEEEKEKLFRYGAELLQDFEVRWNFSEEEYAYIENLLKESKGYVAMDELDSFIEKWYEKQ